MATWGIYWGSVEDLHICIYIYTYTGVISSNGKSDGKRKWTMNVRYNKYIYICIRIYKGIRYHRNDGMKYGNYRRGLRVHDRFYWFRLYGLCHIGILVHDKFFLPRNIPWIDMFCVQNRLKSKGGISSISKNLSVTAGHLQLSLFQP